MNVKPAVGAEYTLSTCQLDFCLPAKFHLTYVDKDGTERPPWCCTAPSWALWTASWLT